MNVQEIREMFDYNYWANDLLLTTAEKVTPEQFLAPSSHSFSSLQATLVHILDSEWLWRLLLERENNYAGSYEEIKPGEFPTVAALRQRWKEEEQEMRGYLDRLHDEDLSNFVRYHTEKGLRRERLIWHALFHVVNHGMQHRSEAANLLTTYGQSPGDLDFTRWLNERAPVSSK